MASSSKQAAKPGLRGFFGRFVHSEVSGSIVLLCCTVAALVWANSPWSESYEHLLHTKIGVAWGDNDFSLSLHHWINDGLMVVFFFVVGLEIKRELFVGQLSSIRQAVLPVAAAIGGMLVPAAFYITLNATGEGSAGWGIPMATDIAFALGTLAILGTRVPIGLKVFLTALAIADDLGAVLVIALFYTEQIRLAGLLIAAVFLLLLLGAIQIRLRRPMIVLILVVGVWVGVFASGVHATVAGILVAMVIPVSARIDPKEFFSILGDRLQRLRESGLSRQSMLDDDKQMTALLEIQDANREMTPVGLALEQFLHPTQAFFILPLFALFNAGVNLGGGAIEALTSPVSLGIILGLFIGKPVGIALMSWFAVRSGKGQLPEGVTWAQIIGAGFLAGIGFTMSLFITELAFKDAILIGSAKTGILAASAISAAVGFFLLKRSLPGK